MYYNIERMYNETIRFVDDLLKAKKQNPTFLDGLFTDYGRLIKIIKPIYQKAQEAYKDITMSNEVQRKKIHTYHRQMEDAINEWVEEWIKKHRSI